MKFLHTADWHLGKLFQNISRIHDQREALEQICAIVEREKPDAVLLAGDIYDRALPPADAVELFDATMHRIVMELGTPVIAIAGNHDSPERVDCYSGLLQKQGLHICGLPNNAWKPVTLRDEHGDVDVYPFPFIEPESARFLFQKPDLQTHQDVMRFVADSIAQERKKQQRRGIRAVLVAHCFVAGGEADEDIQSERKLAVSVGGVETVSVATFAGFHYVALGHLHRAQEFARNDEGFGRIRYSGSPVKYSFSEAAHEKSVSIVEMDATGSVKTRVLPLHASHDVRCVRGHIVGQAFVPDETNTLAQPNDFVKILLTNEETVLDAMAIVRRQFPNALALEYTVKRQSAQIGVLTGEHLQTLTPAQLFALFYEQMTGKELHSKHRNIVQTAESKALEAVNI